MDVADLTLDELRLALAPGIAEAAIFDGWSDAALDMAADQLGADRDVARLAYKDDGAMGMICAWIETIDRQMMLDLPPEKLAEIKIRERIRSLVQYRLDAVAGQEEALRRALVLDPDHPEARYYLGLYFAQVDRPDAAFRVWQSLLDDSTAEDAWTSALRVQIEEAASRAGIRFVLPPLPEPADDTPGLTPPKGPTAQDVAAAQDMSPEARREMIGGMVNGLLERLGNEGGPPEDWARLIASLGILGEVDRAVAIYAEAQDVFQNDPDALEQILRAARAAGLAQ